LGTCLIAEEEVDAGWGCGVHLSVLILRIREFAMKSLVYGGHMSWIKGGMVVEKVSS